MPLPLDDFFRRITGQPMALPGAVPPSGPVTAPTPNAAAVAAPTMQQLQQQDFNNAALSRMGQLGMMLVAAGQRMTPKERATILAQAPQYMDGIQNDMQTAAQARLMNTRAQQEQGEQDRQAALAEKLKDPAFAQSLGLSPNILSALGPQGAIDALKARAARDPVQEAYMLAQMQNMNRPKWQITGTDEFGKSRYDLVGPNGEIMTPKGANGAGGSQSILDQVGDLTGQAALDKLRQISPAIASEVAGIASSNQPFPSKKMGTPEGALLNALVSQVAGPDFNAMDYSSRQKYWDDQRLNSPNSSGGIRKLSETGLRHFKNLIDNSDMLPENDYWVGSQLANKGQILAAQRKADGKDPFTKKLSNYLNTLEIGGDEMAKALGIGSEGGREAVKAMFDPSQGKSVVQQKIKNQIKLLGEKLRGQQDDWNRVMGPIASKRLQIIQPDVAEILKLGEDEQSQEPQAQAPQSNLPHGVRSIRRVN
jgi:hypothetical protein